MKMIVCKILWKLLESQKLWTKSWGVFDLKEKDVSRKIIHKIFVTNSSFQVKEENTGKF